MKWVCCFYIKVSAKQVLLTIFDYQHIPEAQDPSLKFHRNYTYKHKMLKKKSCTKTGKVKVEFQEENTFGLTTELCCPGYPSEPSLLLSEHNP